MVLSLVGSGMVGNVFLWIRSWKTVGQPKVPSLLFFPENTAYLSLPSSGINCLVGRSQTAWLSPRTPGTCFCPWCRQNFLCPRSSTSHPRLGQLFYIFFFSGAMFLVIYRFRSCLEAGLFSSVTLLILLFCSFTFRKPVTSQWYTSAFSWLYFHFFPLVFTVVFSKVASKLLIQFMDRSFTNVVYFSVDIIPYSQKRCRNDTRTSLTCSSFTSISHLPYLRYYSRSVST